jgi:hypothetical protein
MADWGVCDRWSKQVIEHERAQKAAESKTEES